MRIVIAGGSGFIGGKLTNYFANKGYEVIILTRSFKEDQLNISYVEWLGERNRPEAEIKKADVFINLAGVSIDQGRWSKNHQAAIYNSRMKATDELLRIIDALPRPPKVLINASAIGIYPSSETVTYTEKTAEVADDFLGKTVVDWEQKAMSAQNLGIRVACMRFGVILGTDGGALPQMVTPYRFFAGGTVGTGNQWLSWVHLEDVIRAIEFVIARPAIYGPVNVTAPSPQKMKQFGQTIAKTIGRPHWLPLPAMMMRIVLGKKSDLVLNGQYVTPDVLVDNGFTFLFPTLEKALADLLT